MFVVTCWMRRKTPYPAYKFSSIQSVAMPAVDTVMACKFFPGPVSRIAGMPDTAPSGAVFFIPSAIFTPLPDY
ncbi:hypothetical protein, partial [Escherichia coli]|uniref:hypothetical protein n=1 Tax=Escherichia coli TaxID=562 RepID=UPI002017DEB1